MCRVVTHLTHTATEEFSYSLPSSLSNQYINHIPWTPVLLSPRLTHAACFDQERDLINFDHPESLETELMVEHLMVPASVAPPQPSRPQAYSCELAGVPWFRGP